ncbi:MAG: hypothetical protein M3Y87_31880 [Myxococcota bacterium]|nr:hypothetical protein [Myxococcota bacterium]
MIIARSSLSLVALALALSSVIAPSSVDAQRRRRRREPPPPPPVELAIDAMPASDGPPQPFHRVLSLRATAPVELVADRRLLRLELRSEGSRRVTHCEHPDRARRVDPDRVRELAAGERWEEWIDLREYCWGRALDALRTGAEVTVHYGPRRARRGQYVARVPGEPAIEHRTIGPIALAFEPVPEAEDPDPAAPVRVTLSDRDTRSASGVSFRVAVLAREGRTRAYVRSDRFRFRVHGPGGTTECSMTPGGGPAAPDLYQRLTPRSGARFSLDASFYCDGDAFRSQGVYEVVPSVDLEQDGARWGFEAPTGTFVGAPALVRIRRGEGYVEHPIGEPPPPEDAL